MNIDQPIAGEDFPNGFQCHPRGLFSGFRTVGSGAGWKIKISQGIFKGGISYLFVHFNEVQKDLSLIRPIGHLPGILKLSQKIV